VKNTYQNQIFQTIKSFAGEKNILAIPKSFIRFCDEDLYIGLFLSQIVYLSDKGSREDGYIYKSNKEWKEDYFLSDYAIRKAKKYLEDKGIIETKLIKANGAPTTHYRLNREKFTKLFMEFLQDKEGSSNGFVEINDSSNNMDSSKSTNGFEVDESNNNIDSLKSTNGIVESNETLTEITTEINNNKNNKKGEFEKIKNAFKKAFATNPNSFQLEKIKEYMINGLSKQLIMTTLEHSGLGGHNQTFFFNRLSMLVEDEIYTVDQLNSVLSQKNTFKNDSSSSKKETKSSQQQSKEPNYKWKDFFIDYDKYKEWALHFKFKIIIFNYIYHFKQNLSKSLKIDF